MTGAVLDGVFGLDMPEERYDLLSFRHIKPIWRDYEVSLMTAKWWDYRFMNPVAATYLFAHHYIAEYKATHRRAINYNTADHVKPLGVHGDMFSAKPAIISAMWRGRQHADAMCIPYNFYIRWALEARMSYWARAKMPTPQQLYSEMITDIVQRKWDAHLEGVFEYGQHDAYLAANYAGLAAQDEHVEWMFDLAAKRANVGATLAALFNKGFITSAHIVRRYNKEVAERVIDAAQR